MPNPSFDRQFAWAISQLLELVARHGHLRRVAGPLVTMIWQRVRGIQRQVDGLLTRYRAGTLRRYPHRRTPARQAGSRPPTRPPERPARGWVQALIPETGMAAGHLLAAMQHPEFPELLQQIPQLRRALRPLARMLHLSLPPAPRPPGPPPAPAAAPASTTPLAPTSRQRRPDSDQPPRARRAPWRGRMFSANPPAKPEPQITAWARTLGTTK